MKTQTIYGQLAPLFEYPGESYRARAEECCTAITAEHAGASGLLAEFCHSIQTLSVDELQELFTRTFDLNPVCTLEIGWHLFGEDYQRGEFLVKMRGHLRERSIEETTELPDHLTYALRLLDLMEAEEAAEFVEELLLPALGKMRDGWKSNHNAFWPLLEAAFTLLASRYTYHPERYPVRASELVVLP